MHHGYRVRFPWLGQRPTLVGIPYTVYLITIIMSLKIRKKLFLSELLSLKQKARVLRSCH